MDWNVQSKHNNNNNINSINMIDNIKDYIANDLTRVITMTVTCCSGSETLWEETGFFILPL